MFGGARPRELVSVIIVVLICYEVSNLHILRYLIVSSKFDGIADPALQVLKERGIDDVAINNHDVGQSPNR